MSSIYIDLRSADSDVFRFLARQRVCVNIIKIILLCPLPLSAVAAITSCGNYVQLFGLCRQQPPRH